MIGLSALLAGQVRLPREVLLLEGLVGLLVTADRRRVAAALVLAGCRRRPVALVLIPYLTLVIAGARLLDRLADRPRSPTARLARALHEHPRPERPPDPFKNPTHHLLALIVVDVALIVAGSAGMVETALTLAGDWHIPNAVLGFLILAPLTSIPNAATAVRLGLARRGAALVGETFNSNTINLAAGVVAALAVRDALPRSRRWASSSSPGSSPPRSSRWRRWLGPVGCGAPARWRSIALYFAFVVGTLVGS